MGQSRVRLFQCILFVALCGYGFHKAPDDKSRMVYTTRSEKARSLFEKGLAMYDGAQPKPATALFDKAIEADPNFALALLFRGLVGDSNSHIRKAAELSGTASEAERLLLGDQAAAEKLMKEIASYTLGSVPSSIARPEALRWLSQNRIAR
jgi:Tfp pilus assembly protein PilF